MSSHKKHEKLQKIKDAINNASGINEEEKSNAMKIVEEWALEDKAENLLYEELVKVAERFEEILEEIGLI